MSDDLATIDNSRLNEEAKSRGFFYLPPTIDEFVSYLDLDKVIYPIWLEHLRKIYPDNLHVSNNYILLTGAIGTGKSTVSKIAALYTVAKLLHLKDFSQFYLAITKAIQLVFFHVKIEKARHEFIQYITDLYETHKYFQEIKTIRKKLGIPNLPISFVADGVKSNSSIGGDVIFYVFSEANFVNEDMIKFKIDQAYNRFKSRFIAAKDYLGNIIIDTSSSYEGSILDHLGSRAEDFYTVRVSQWQAKAHTGLFFKKGSIWVYMGGKNGDPKVIGDKGLVPEEELTKYESDRIIEVPKELEKEFRNDTYEALISLAGVSIQAPNSLFRDDLVMEVMDIRSSVPDAVPVDELLLHLDSILSALPTDRKITIHIDTSIRGDNTGIAIGYWYDDTHIYIPVAFAIHNYSLDIPMHIIEDFIVRICINRQVFMVTSDTYQSYKLLQDITRKGRAPTETISTDQNPNIYFNLKRAIIDKTVHLPHNKILLRELATLRYQIVGSSFKPKIDHPTSGSKDIADAVASVHYNLREKAKKHNIVSSLIIQEIENYKRRIISSRIIGPYNNKYNNT